VYDKGLNDKTANYATAVKIVSKIFIFIGTKLGRNDITEKEREKHREE
jgi:hypothetical protein